MKFAGESENWQVIYEVNILDQDSESTNLIVKYIGAKPIPQKIKYVVEGLSGKSAGEDSLNNGVLKIGGHSCNGCAVTQENEEKKATITWNDKSDIIILKNQ
ncbi:hypothetical protein [Bacillus sp. EB01]|uniref:hypothetical protein n=1 Tax=Bacillus sp. EB01 TaxID=1347086 RepID=UPI0005C5BAED|nr:hypothetical protein [Bacillus sp. EB01]